MNEEVVETPNINIEIKEKKTKKTKNTDECLELKNIKYQTMLINNNNNNPVIKEKINNIDNFLDQEKKHNQKQPWCKLGNGTKIRKINVYVNEYSIKNKLNDEEKKKLKGYLKKSMERKKLQRVKDVQYDIENQKIINIPGLLYHKEKNKFTLKNLDKNSSTLKSLAPKRRKHKKKIKKNTNTSTN